MTTNDENILYLKGLKMIYHKENHFSEFRI